jgi:hypothetical protein
VSGFELTTLLLLFYIPAVTIVVFLYSICPLFSKIETHIVKGGYEHAVTEFRALKIIFPVSIGILFIAIVTPYWLFYIIAEPSRKSFQSSFYV